jgi:hypothetical protein
VLWRDCSFPSLGFGWRIDSESKPDLLNAGACAEAYA